MPTKLLRQNKYLTTVIMEITVALMCVSSILATASWHQVINHTQCAPWQSGGNSLPLARRKILSVFAEYANFARRHYSWSGLHCPRELARCSLHPGLGTTTH